MKCAPREEPPGVVRQEVVKILPKEVQDEEQQ